MFECYKNKLNIIEMLDIENLHLLHDVHVLFTSKI